MSLLVSATYMCARHYGERGFRLCESPVIFDMARRRRSSDASRASLKKRSARAALLCGTTEQPAANSVISSIAFKFTAAPANHAEDRVARAKSEAFAKAGDQRASAAVAKIESAFGGARYRPSLERKPLSLALCRDPLSRERPE